MEYIQHLVKVYFTLMITRLPLLPHSLVFRLITFHLWDYDNQTELGAGGPTIPHTASGRSPGEYGLFFHDYFPIEGRDPTLGRLGSQTE